MKSQKSQTVSENENSVKQLSQSFLLSVTLHEVLQTAISLEFQEAARWTENKA